jgi:dTDP-glucose 4,6-dehydratase
VTYQRIAVIGSNSFSGSHFVHHVLGATTAQVLGISRSPEYDTVFLPYRYQREPPARFRFAQLDMTIEGERLIQELHAFEPDLVVNFAAQGEVRNSWRWPEQWFQTNCLSIVRLAQALKGKPWLRRYIAISTPEVYGSTAPNLVESNSTFSPSTPYAASKAASDMFLIALLKEGSVPVTFVRSANVYGPHQQLFRIIPKTILSMRLGKKIPLHGGGRGRRAFLHIQDACECTLRAATIGRVGEVYHQAPNGEVISIADVVRMICHRLGTSFEDSTILDDENYGQDAMYSLDATKARMELGWHAKRSFVQGIDETVTWIDDNLTTLRNLRMDYVHKP